MRARQRALQLRRPLLSQELAMSLRRMAAIVVTALLGAIIGLLAGFFNSGLVGVSRGFWYWISYPPDSWHWPILGLLVGCLSSLALHLWRPDSAAQKGPPQKSKGTSRS